MYDYLVISSWGRCAEVYRVPPWGNAHSSVNNNNFLRSMSRGCTVTGFTISAQNTWYYLTVPLQSRRVWWHRVCNMCIKIPQTQLLLDKALMVVAIAGLPQTEANNDGILGCPYAANSHSYVQVVKGRMWRTPQPVHRESRNQQCKNSRRPAFSPR